MLTTQPYRLYFKEDDENMSCREYWDTGLGAAGCIFIAKDTGRILLAHRSDNVDFEPNTWGTWGGKIDEGENPLQTVEREVEEETGFSGQYKVNYLWTFHDPAANFKYHNYLVIVPHEFHPRLNWENDDSEWVEYGEWPEPLHFGMVELLKHASSKIERILQLCKQISKQRRNSVGLDEIADAPPASIQNMDISANFLNYIKSVENNTKVGFKNGRWYPHRSAEGGNDTIAYGHKITNDELHKFIRGITEKEAEALLINDLKKSRDIVSKAHDKWIADYIKKAQTYARSHPADPKSKFYLNLKPSDPVFHINQNQVEMLTDFAFNLGGLNAFPKFVDSVFRKDWNVAKREYKRSYKDVRGDRHELGRNKAFYAAYLKGVA